MRLPPKPSTYLVPLNRSESVQISSSLNSCRFYQALPVIFGQAASLPSGAGHDAQAIATVTPSAMVFVPSVGGISHAPAEYTTPEDCANGAQVLLNAMALADER